MEWLSVKDFAELAGVTQQAVYKRLPNIEQQFVKVESGKKLVSTEALGLFADNKNNQQGCATQPTKPTGLNDEVMLELIKTLQAQLVEKDKQLEQAAAEKAALLERLKDAQQAELQAHALHAGTMQTALIESSAGTDQQEKPRKGWRAWFKRSKQ